MIDKTYMNKHPLIHVLPQEAWHSHAAIIGNHEGLAMLRELINSCLSGAELVSSGNCSGNISVSCNDGEGYNMTVAVRADMSDVPLGYIYEHARDDSKYPEWLVEAIRG